MMKKRLFPRAVAARDNAGGSGNGIGRVSIGGLTVNVSR